jgi:hypothetical protein
MHMEKWIVFSLAAMLSVPLVAVKAAALDTDPAEPLTGLEQSSLFSIVVNAAGPGISASCEHGCAWKIVSARYPQGAYRITEQGIQPVQDDVQSAAGQAQPSGFSIVMTTTGKRVSATCAKGCAWKTVSAAYPASTYRITEHGIEPTRQRVE